MGSEPEPRRSVVVVANPYSGSGNNLGRAEALARALREVGLEPRLVADPGERTELLTNPCVTGRCRAVVVVGGDGTVGDVINTNPATLPLAALPSGNENLFALACGFTADVRALAEAVAAGRTRRIDLGRANGRLFSLMVTVGFDADVLHRAARWRASIASAAGAPLRRVTRMSYVRPIAAALWNYDASPVELEAGPDRAQGAQCFVFNLPRYALALPISPEALARDGLLDWIVLERPGRLHLARYTYAVLRSKHLGRRDVRHGRADRIRISSESPKPVQIDGEAHGVTPVEIEVAPLALPVIVP